MMFNINDVTLKKDTRQREKTKVVNKIVDFIEGKIKKEYVQVFNNWGSGIGKSGRPDLEIIFNYNTWHIEAKDPKGKLSTIQKARIRMFGNTGVKIHVINDANDFISNLWITMSEDMPIEWLKEDQ